ncbi:helicase-related protein [Bradyrhizobium elkanii]|uniref:helicase-related protein n=1 Tax=Bradyrhizobium elkanii TaxID=29448 RepID=UPI003519612C
MSTRSGRTSVVFASGLGNALLHGIGVHHGGVPRALQQYFIRQFNDRKVPYLVCTSTIIEGVNTVAKNVVVYDRRKSKSVLEHFTYKNIEGRAGRMNHYFVGKVYVLEAPPTDKSFSVEFPVGVQRETTPLSLLLSLPDDDLRPISKERVADLFSKSFLSPLTLRANRHVSRDAQEAVANEVLSNIARWRVLLSWTWYSFWSRTWSRLRPYFPTPKHRGISRERRFFGRPTRMAHQRIARW